ncbi:hypothetical protein ACQKK5_08115 [Brevibacillus panacihumi]|uniref:hypothetical protein n=1 Tax=Brevibacillus panacihumi TaxID=497735 RepID=UPI003D01588E
MSIFKRITPFKDGKTSVDFAATGAALAQEGAPAIRGGCCGDRRTGCRLYSWEGCGGDAAFGIARGKCAI